LWVSADFFLLARSKSFNILNRNSEPVAEINSSVLATPGELPGFWIFMYCVSPLTYFLEGLAVAGLYNTRISCSSIEELYLPLAVESISQNCGEYLSSLARSMNSRIINPSSEADCRFCPISEVNIVLEGFGMTTNIWRDAGLMAAYVMFNIVATFGIYWLVRVPRKHKGR
jgi:ATP-binding cassette, subfamily G (WHITE), member 2, PDR